MFFTFYGFFLDQAAILLSFFFVFFLDLRSFVCGLFANYIWGLTCGGGVGIQKKKITKNNNSKMPPPSRKRILFCGYGIGWVGLVTGVPCGPSDNGSRNMNQSTPEPSSVTSRHPTRLLSTSTSLTPQPPLPLSNLPHPPKALAVDSSPPLLCHLHYTIILH